MNHSLLAKFQEKLRKKSIFFDGKCIDQRISSNFDRGFTDQNINADGISMSKINEKVFALNTRRIWSLEKLFRKFLFMISRIDSEWHLALSPSRYVFINGLNWTTKRRTTQWLKFSLPQCENRWCLSTSRDEAALIFSKNSNGSRRRWRVNYLPRRRTMIAVKKWKHWFNQSSSQRALSVCEKNIRICRRTDQKSNRCASRRGFLSVFPLSFQRSIVDINSIDLWRSKRRWGAHQLKWQINHLIDWLENEQRNGISSIEHWHLTFQTGLAEDLLSTW